MTPTQTESLLASLMTAFGRVEGGLISPGKPDGCARDIPSTKGAYPFIPFHVDAFVKMLMAAERHVKTGRGRSDEMRFLDVGAGYGTKVILAQTILGNWSCHGIEIEKRYVDTRLTERVELADGLTYADYAAYDIIYMYCPYCDADLQVKLQQAAIDGARPGAIILFAGCCKPMNDAARGYKGYYEIAPDRFTDKMEQVKIPTLDQMLDRFIWRKKGYAVQSAPKRAKAPIAA